MIVKIQREKLRKLNEEIYYLFEIFNTMLEPVDLEDLKIQIKFMRLTAHLINVVLKDIEEEFDEDSSSEEESEEEKCLTK